MTHQQDFTETETIEEILPRIRLDNKDIPKLAKVIDKFVEDHPLNWHPNAIRADISLEKAVNDAHAAGFAIIQSHLAEAEDAVRKLDELRARVREFDAQSE